jgi:RNA polymerase nonessential primary-like sigma factor
MADTALDDYLASISRVPLLSRDEEIILGRQVQRWVNDRDSDDPCPRIARVGQRAFHRMVRANLRLVVAASKKFYGVRDTLGIARMDLIQEGNLGLMRGVEKFDPERGYKFSTYGYWWIRQAMCRAISQSGRIIRLPSSANEVLAKVRHWVYEQAAVGVNPSLQECASFAGVAPATLEHYLIHSQGIASLDAPAGTISRKASGDREGSAIVDLIPGTDSNSIEAAWERMELERLHETISGLSDLEHSIIDRVYGLTTGKPESLRVLGEERQLSRERIRQIKERALRRLRERNHVGGPD